MAVKCKGCGEDLPANGAYAECGKCNGGFHFDACSSYSERGWHSLASSKKAAYRCADCKTKTTKVMTRSGSNNSLASNQSDGGELAGALATAMLNFEGLLNKKFQEFTTSFEKKIDGRFKEFEKNLEYNSGVVEDLKKTIKDMEKKMVTLEKNNEKVENQNQELRKRVRNLESFVQDMAQERNACKIEISGKFSQIEDCKVFVEKVLEKAEINEIVKKGEYQVEKIEKFVKKGSPPEIKNLIITVKDIETKDKMLEIIKKKRTTLNTTGLTGQAPPVPIYINEYLTPYLKRVHFEAKQLKRDKGYEFLWVKNGRILIKKNQNSNVIRLSCLEDLPSL